ncbi:DUF2330 domain-containing protein [Streptomyces sp. YIM S03343]
MLTVLSALLVVLGMQLGLLLTVPAFACGCGALVPDGNRQVTVGREESVVRWDGHREQIVMRLRVGGDADSAAWIMPVPHRATVRLGDPALFDQLASLTAPVHRVRHHFWPRDGDWPLVSHSSRPAVPPPPLGPAGAAAPAVGVVGRRHLGPFEVARLTATDPDALRNWLNTNGFPLPSRLTAALRPYVAAGWEYVAVRLAPTSTGAGGDTPGAGSTGAAGSTGGTSPRGDSPRPVLGGTLDPLHLTFAAASPVYPMRLSRLAGTPQSLGLYVLAGHRMELRSAIGGDPARVVYAGRVSARRGPLAGLAAGAPFLTAVDQEFPEPWRISGDHTLRRAARDTAFQQVIYDDRLTEVAGVPAWLLTVVGGLVLAAGAAAVPAVRRAECIRRRANAPSREPDGVLDR